MQLPHFHFLPVAAAASDAPQGSWLEGGRAEAEGRKLQEFFATKQTLLCHTAPGWVALVGEHGKSLPIYLSIGLPIQLSVREAKGVSGDGGRILAMRRPVTLLPTGP